MRETLRDFSGKIIGYVEVDSQGNKVLKDFYGKILGRYDARQNVTKDFYGKIITKGDCLTMLLK